MILVVNVSYASSKIRVAVLDNFHYQKYVTTQYKSYYIKGIELAIRQANENDNRIVYRVFQYNQSPLSILDTLKELDEWNPDVVLGPRDSNKFLLLEKYISDTLTLSPFATSTRISTLPSNFHSLTLLDNYSAKAMYEFINSAFPKKGIFVITEANCKSCMDVSNELIKIWTTKKGISPNQSLYVQDNIPDSKVLLKGYKKGDLIVLPNMAHSSAVLMATITNQLASTTTFIGGDGWGSWSDTEAGKLKSNNRYVAYHLVPWGLQGCSQSLIKYRHIYEENYNEPPVDKLSYISFMSLNSIINAYDKYGSMFTGSTKERLLSSYQQAIKQDPFFFKPTDYLVYKIDGNTNILNATVNVVTGKITNYTDGDTNTTSCIEETDENQTDK